MSYSGLTERALAECLKPIAKEVSSYCGYDVDLDLNSNVDKGEIRYDTLHPVGSVGHKPIAITLGAQRLVANIDPNGVIRDEDFVWTVFQAFHEATHAKCVAVEFMRKDVSEDIEAMARDFALETHFPEYKKYVYSNNANEIYADREALRETKSLFDGLAAKDARFASIDIDAVLVSQEQ